MSNVRRSAYLLTFLIGAALVTAMAWKPAPPARFGGVTSADVPLQLGAFRSGGEDQVAPEVKQALSSAGMVSRSYTDGVAPLDFVLISGTDRSALHDPRSCLVGAGWRLENDHTEPLPGADVMVRSCRAVGGPGGAEFDMLYVYVVDGKIVNQVTQIRTQMLWSALLGRKNTPVHFLRFIAPTNGDTSPQTAAQEHARLAQFAGRMWTALRPKLLAASR